MATKNERIPPLPPKLKEMLVDYPEILQQLQDALIDAAQTKSYTLPLDLALWSLEDIMAHHMGNAGAERQAAEARGDPVEIEAAIAKHRLMARAGSRGVGLNDMKEFYEFFDKIQESRR